MPDDASSRRRHVLVLAYWYPPENQSGAFRPFRFCKYLPDHGYRPLVIAAPCSFACDPVPDVHRPPGVSSALRANALAAALSRSVQRVAPYNDELEWVPHAVATASRLMSTTPAAAIFSTAPPVGVHVAAAILQRRYGVPWIADFRDPLIGNPSRRRWHGRVYDRLLERYIVARASAVIVNTDAVLGGFKKRYPDFRDKCHLIWNGYDPDDDLAARPIPTRGHKIIAHVGAMYAGRHPSALLSGLARLLERGHVQPGEVKIRLVGSIDSNAPWLAHPARAFLAERGCLELTGTTVPRNEARREMTEADYLLLLDLNEGLQVPAKIFEYVRVGRPILAYTPKGSPVERILAGSGVPYVCVHPEDPEDAVESKILRLLATPTAATAPSEAFRQQFDAVAQTMSLATLLDSALSATVRR
jgi:hypothetical protein